MLHHTRCNRVPAHPISTTFERNDVEGADSTAAVGITIHDFFVEILTCAHCDYCLHKIHLFFKALLNISHLLSRSIALLPVRLFFLERHSPVSKRRTALLQRAQASACAHTPQPLVQAFTHNTSFPVLEPCALASIRQSSIVSTGSCQTGGRHRCSEHRRQRAAGAIPRAHCNYQLLKV